MCCSWSKRWRSQVGFLSGCHGYMLTLLLTCSAAVGKSLHLFMPCVVPMRKINIRISSFALLLLKTGKKERSGKKHPCIYLYSKV